MRKDIPGNSLAYEYYLRGISYPLTNEGDRLAIKMLNKSIELDSLISVSIGVLGWKKSFELVFVVVSNLSKSLPTLSPKSQSSSKNK